MGSFHFLFAIRYSLFFPPRPFQISNLKFVIACFLASAARQRLTLAGLALAWLPNRRFHVFHCVARTHAHRLVLVGQMSPQLQDYLRRLVSQLLDALNGVVA